MKKNWAFQDYAKRVLWLRTARTDNPDIPQPHLSALDFHKYHLDTIRHPPFTPQIPPRQLQRTQDANRNQQTQTDSPGHPKTLPVAAGICLLASAGVCLCLLVSAGTLSSLGMSWGCLGGVWGMSDGICVVFMAIGDAQMWLGDIWVISPSSTEL